MGKTTIRPATYDDLDILLDLSAAMHKESPRFSRIEFSMAKMLSLFITLIDSESGLVLVADRDGAVVGAVAAMVCAHWMSDDIIANEYGVFILPQHRGGMTAARLVRSYIEWGKAKGAKMIQLGISTDVLAEETAALYQALGLKQFSIGFEV